MLTFVVHLQELLSGVDRRQVRRLLVLACLAAVGNVGVLAVLNTAASDPDMASGVRELVLILFLIGIYRVAQRAMIAGVAGLVEETLHHRRLRLVGHMLQADLLALEAIGRQSLFTGIARHSQTISESLTVLLVGLQSVILVACVLLYIATLSMLAFLLTSGFIVATLLVQRAGAGQVRIDLAEATGAEAKLFGGIGDLLDGFKEVRMNAARARALLADLGDWAGQTAQAMERLRLRTADQFVIGQVGLLLLLGATVFLVPLFVTGEMAIIAKVTTAILFVISAVGMLVQAVPVVAQANDAARRMAALERELAAADAQAARPAAASPLPVDFSELTLDGLGFQHAPHGGEPGFAIGPLDLVLRRGEMVFLTGGNGSGKSTLLRLLTGLYLPASGQIRLDGTAVTPDNLQDYRTMIAAVFGDYHLFRHIHHMPPGGAAQVGEGLRMMELEGKTALKGNRFTTLDLSAGQRRRLALMLALMRDCSILIMDEVAADFDPGFRKHFYEEILPEIKKSGKTIIAASHDDRYFHLADRIVHLQDGRIDSISGSPS